MSFRDDAVHTFQEPERAPIIVPVDDLIVNCSVHKYVDDTTLTEVVQGSAHSNMQYSFQQLLSWFEHNDMVVSSQKTMEMVMGHPSL